MSLPARKVVVLGAGFIGTHVARTLAFAPSTLVQLSSRSPSTASLSYGTSSPDARFTAVPADITDPASLERAFHSAHAVISLVGIMHGSDKQFQDIQWRGAENVARAAHAAGAKLVHLSAIGAHPDSDIPYFRTKALGEQAVLGACPNATVLRPSLVFGPGDGFFARFASLSRFLPFLPVFGGGNSRFQPVFVGDLAHVIEICTRDDSAVQDVCAGKVIQCGGPDVLTYREMMSLILKHTHRTRPIISLPWAAGFAQGFIMERLPLNPLTLTRAQVKQLQMDNIVDPDLPPDAPRFEDVLKKFAGRSLTPLDDVLPTYL
ncbi:hypothetical protein BOTBODRAFT_26509 [Botryobasidium botryosum FD-172 SS1]|uniref:NAD-dependent epimerase/dehydratase domain-containing protein n=1 Tax=Botryobasidium botryosum (strain FD-172 SS1) TaxID=930990 RepID=A0A067MY04_BOTB1|nr:hypothetical protein BOTBODRAFT_26509 [Botryobasidium botryosum FD-172 SS1]